MIDTNSQIKSLVNRYSPILHRVEKIDDADYCVVDDAGQIIACVKMKKVNWYLAEISHLVVQPGLRRQGYGQEVVRKALRKAREEGSKLAVCTIHTTNDASQALFHRAGFRPVVEFPGLSGRSVAVWQLVL
jgi:N-acetylglutamate synthase-like GNAT family acetyltransferase